MASMFSGFSSAIGKKLLLFGLRHIDILDKDPAEFVNVDVGKKTTLEIKDVGLHVKKLAALLHLQLPPEILLTTARAAVFRTTVEFQFGVPHIKIEVHGIQTRVRLVEDVNTVSKSRGTERTPPRDRSPAVRRTSDGLPDSLSDEEDSHMPTVDDLAESFIREEPEEEIKELEQELELQSASLQESVTSSDDDDDESVAGMGAPIALPQYFKNLLNTALDRLQIIVTDIDLEVQDDYLSSEASSEEDSHTSLNFHVDRVAIDSVTAEDPRVDVTASRAPQDVQTKLGKRRLRIENICGRLILDAERFFASTSRSLAPSSPVDTKSEVSSSLKTQSEPATSEVGQGSEILGQSIEAPSIRTASVNQLPQAIASHSELHQSENTPLFDQTPQPDSTHEFGETSQSEQVSIQPPSDPAVAPEVPDLQQHPLISSAHITEDDRFADADSDEGLDRSMASLSSNRSVPPYLGGGSHLYDDEGFLDNAMFDSRLYLDQERVGSDSANNIPNLYGMGSSHEAVQSLFYDSQSSSANLPTVSMLGRSVEPPPESESLANSTISHQYDAGLDLQASQRSLREEAPSSSSEEISLSTTNERAPIHEVMSESKSSSEGDTQSMYMSAMSATPAHDGHVPGGWESSSSASSRAASSSASGDIPEEMITGSILQPRTAADDGCDTPRPNSPQSVFSSPQETRRASVVEPIDSGRGRDAARKLFAKVFLTVDEVTVWFPLGLDQATMSEPAVEASGMDFHPSGMVEDSIFETMPGTFSYHAASSRKKSKVDDVIRQRLDPRTSPTPRKSSANVSFEVGTLLFHMDFATGQILMQMLTKTTSFLTRELDTPPKHPINPEENLLPKSSSAAELSVTAVCIAWRERLPAESLTEDATTALSLELEPSDAIVKISMSSLYGANQISAAEIQTKLEIGKFSLSSLDQEIITFQSNRSKNRRLANQASEQLKHDVEIIYEQKQDRRLTLVTRPVKLMLDVEKLDEALNPFGGFSGILEMSSSINSNARANSPVATPAQNRPRGVHFGDTPPPPTVSSSTLPKIQLQFGDVSFVLRGRSCAVQLQTTSVKLAVRGSNVRLKVTDAQFTGPYTGVNQSGAPLLVKIQDTTLNLLSAPEEVDLDNLINMITPSKDPYENDEDILIDTLLRQRKKGSVLRLNVTKVDVRVFDPNELQAFSALGAELAKLSKITKYLPDDDRPGILSLIDVQNVGVTAVINERLGEISVELEDTSVAHVGIPALFATQIGTISVWREGEVLVHEVVKLAEHDRLPMVMLRIIGDEMEPIIKAKLFNLCAEYRVTTVMAALGLSEDGTIDDMALGLASSVATITGATSPATLSRQDSASSSPAAPSAKPLHLDILFRNCALGLNPRKISAKGLFVLTDARFLGKQSDQTDYWVQLELRKASLQAIDDVARLNDTRGPTTSSSKTTITNPQLRELQGKGYISLSSIAAAKVVVKIIGDGGAQPQKVDVEFENELFVIESCADSTQTLFAILGGLSPPTPPSTAERYRPTVPLSDMMQSFTMDALANDPDVIPMEDDDGIAIGDDSEDFEDDADLVPDEVPTNREFVGSFYNPDSLPTEEDMGDSMLEQDDLGAFTAPPSTRKLGEPAMLESFEERYEVAPGQEQLDFDDNYFKDSDSDYKGKARKWNSSHNRYESSNEFKSPNAPLKVQVRNMNIIWNLFDGYDWPKTRGELAQVIDDIEARAEQRRQKAQSDEELEFVEEGQLFNSVWIGIPVRDGKGALANKVIHDINERGHGSDGVSETGSYATSTATRTTTATVRPGSNISTRRLQKLGRGKHKRIAFELKNVAVDLVVFEPGSGETVSSVDVRIQDLTVYDHMPASTWNKFALCDIEPAKREMNRPMVNLAILTVKPAPDLAATELVIEVSILPLRLYVDQFALEFIERFFAFKDESAISSSTPAAPSEQAFIQRLDIKTVQLCLDYKPRKVDYRSIRSGSTSEFKNFVILEGTPVLLRRAILYGIKSLDELHDTLSDIWTPDVIRNQLGQVLSGVAMARPIVNVGSAVADLFTVSMREYKKDGRAVRAMRKGMGVFARNTTTEAARLIAKTAIGAQNLLEGAVAFTNPERPSSSRRKYSHDWEDLASSDIEEPRAISNYADQPVTVRAGLRSAARHFKKDLETARDAAIAIPGEIQAEGTGAGLARVLYRRAPTVILKPLAGTTKVVSKTLMGVGNALDKDARRKIDDKYKTY
ncbi:hypothetical protein GRF29_164g1315948 [Pseudopithomyces chartarum]|uniref:Autophagy-related protein 2 n=1 Tax=Pseudopithomyces chartarum TaxID=1892770 RepID=A0AAN6RCY3_9PLEO|nr:hypothetical protein GRF29_164g1315948 [Pseudopithomyces chartarum]